MPLCVYRTQATQVLYVFIHLYRCRRVRMTRWLWRKCPTRSHSELGRESLQRRWYFVLRHGRVGRCLVFQLHVPPRGGSLILPTVRPVASQPGFFLLDAGWSSPVARKAHNLKVVGSNPTPATKKFLPTPLSSWMAVFYCPDTASSRIAARPPTSRPY